MADGRDGRGSTIREGILAGFLSATVIAVWLFIVDVIARHPLFTPRILGKGLVSILGIRMADTTSLYVAAYTVFHYAAFAVIGILLATIVHAARRTPAILAGFLMMFIAFEFGFYGLAAMLSVNSDLKSLAWYQIMAANLLAAVVMFYFMWVRHPELKGEFSDALGGTDA
ncbi:MAG: hypothetical protein ACR2M1_01980 [Gemmatimonadaceae bacterium]